MSDFNMAADPPVGWQSDNGHPVDIVCMLNVVIQILCMVLILAVVGIRIWVRRKIENSMHLEDWFSITATILFCFYCGNAITMSSFGGGMHIWDVTQHHYERFLYGVWRSTVLYGPAALFIKITLLLIFTRIWAPFCCAVFCINTLIGLLVLYYVPMFVLKILVCNPVHGFWDFAVKATCLDINKIFLADTIMSVLSDFAIMFIPIPLIWDLNLSLVKKMKLFGILGAGGIATVASAARLYYVCTIFENPDKTVTFVEFSMLGSLELFLGLLCASLPAFNALFTRCLGSRHETGALVAKSKAFTPSEGMYSDVLPKGKFGSLQRKLSGISIEKVHLKDETDPGFVRGRAAKVGVAYHHFMGRVLRRERV